VISSASARAKLTSSRAFCAAARSPSTQSANSARSAGCRAPTRARYMPGHARRAVFRPRSSTTVIAGSDSTRTQNRVNPRLTAALDGKTGRDQQQSKGGEVADINAVRRSQRDQERSFWERFNDHEPDGHGGQHEGLEPAAALGRSRHLQIVTIWC
jgi:hypothetical protein